ncbi:MULTISPECIES: GNAT family N-acetyltransferase [Streptomyces]|uniref:GNAT family N-acetyltransferase n=1 Tax=Streptomyces koyangensis TaxID=188770 RepID=A0A385DF50_9ACTN|nr:MULTISPECIES: GNAT family N-acetyltransferase [Streptomyces]AXQ56534.1 GNAT family N-acetyltransferase [Streptomyces koyangensis]PKR43877.1 GNAT family N-acetyltransferase [Streptomyces sp. EAG2]WTD03468.1 GNAT family N-acetyltransferase [Streptomyces albidoflavus]
MKIIDLPPDDPRLTTDALPVLAELRPHLTARLLEEVYAAGHPQGLRFSALYDTESRCVAVAGWRVIANTSAVRKLYVDDLVTAEAARSTGAGRELVAYLEDRARELDCRVLDLDSGTQRTDAHRFYLRERFSIRAFHFTKLLR